MEFIIKDKIVLIDEEDFDSVKDYNWHFMKGYARRRDGNKHIYLHQVIFGKKKGLVIDHIDQNPLNNQKSNLRFCSVQQNGWNRKKKANKTSKYMGVCLAIGNRTKPYRALLKGKLLGYFENEIDAAKEYDKNAKKLYGKYIKLNFPEK